MQPLQDLRMSPPDGPVCTYVYSSTSNLLAGRIARTKRLIHIYAAGLFLMVMTMLLGVFYLCAHTTAGPEELAATHSG